MNSKPRRNTDRQGQWSEPPWASSLVAMLVATLEHLRLVTVWIDDKSLTSLVFEEHFKPFLSLSVSTAGTKTLNNLPKATELMSRETGLEA